MFKSKLSKVIVLLLRRIAGVTRSGAKRLMRAMLQALMAMSRRAQLPVAGFVLPTVTMVLLVVILLTVAITLRSFDRANTARNVRVNQQVLAAATPAIDRAKAKIQYLLEQTGGRGTPSDEDLYLVIANPIPGTDNYTFKYEERLKLQYNLDGTGGISPDLGVNVSNFNLATNESINTAWRYPVDTNNDGKFDTFTLYGIFFRTPPRDDAKLSPTVGEFLRPRKPLEARTPPMSVGGLNPKCLQGGGTAASLAGDSGWYRLDGKLKKSFFVYTVNVPITDTEATALGTNYQKFTGTSSISALEYQQDQIRIPIANNAVVYEDDLEISPGPPLNLNGRVFTNSNLLVSGASDANSIKLYQVSSPESCFYEQENSKIVVAGNVVNGVSTDNETKKAVDVHLYKKASLPAVGTRTTFMAVTKKLEIKTSEESASNPTLEVLYNNEAYTKRLDLLVEAQMGQNGTNPETNDPLLVQQRPDTQDRKQALTEYFKQLTRKVPFAEVPLVGGDATTGYGLAWATPAGTPPIEGTQDTLRPVEKWSLPNPGDTKINLKLNKLEATNPIPEPPTEEAFLGDRVVAGNNLPALRWDGAKFINTPETVAAKWNPTDSGTTRERSPQVTKLADVGATERDGFWEGEAARYPENPLDGNGGLRVITGAGVYERKNSFLPPPTWINPADGATLTGDTATYDDPATPSVEEFPVVWPDSMPMSPLGQGSKVYDNSAGGLFNAANWINWPGTVLPTTPLQPPGGLPPEGLPLAVTGSIDPNTPQYAKGDLRMRATVVYHYADDPPAPGEFNDKPLACVSSYYDPSTASTARNLVGLPDVSGDTTLGERGTQVGSNNGVVYSASSIVAERAIGPLTPVNGLFPGGTALAQQANLVFPDGRFANPLLREALKVADTNRTLAQKAAIDSTNCALYILTNPTPAPTLIPPGAIKEVAFLNGREIKAIDRDDWTTNVNEAFTLSSPTTGVQEAKLTGNYNLPLEERQPLEIRATRIDIDVLRRNKPSGIDEPLLPNSGIIYATRDDALPDRSFRPALAAGGIDESRSETVSPTDSLLDPTRKPNGILLVNGKELARVPSPTTPTVADVVLEKGLTLASNLPVYIQGDFNLHSKQEFDPPGNLASFYDRTNLDKNFACRPKDPRLAGNCITGDTWRPANVLSDAVTLLSQNYRFGFRNEGDFDLRNNAGAAAVMPRKQQGFYSNNFVTNGLSSGAFKATSGTLVNTGGTAVTDANYANNSNPVNSSYFNNFVTPVQRRGSFAEYVMEVCNKIPVSACTDNDWYVNPATSGKATVGEDITANNYLAGTTARAPAPELQRFPRRVAFWRSARTATTDPLDTPNDSQPLGISGTAVTRGPGTNLTTANSLWFATTTQSNRSAVTYGSNDFPYVFNQARKDGSGSELPELAATSAPVYPLSALPGTLAKGSQPLLMPVLQFQTVTAAPARTSSTSLPAGVDIVTATGWISKAVKTTYNAVVGSNDTPSRSLGNGVGDSNGGVQNLTRFLESWNGDVAPTVIQGSFIQFNRSAYSTAPYIPILNPTAPQQADPLKLRSLFDSPPTQALTPLNPATPAPVSVTYTGGAPVPFYRTSIANITVNGKVVGRLPFFTPPKREWGFDVGLLSQPPDLFTRKFTTPPSTPTPAEYFREVARDDDWVKTLMCGVVENTTTKATETLTTAERNNCST
ncbi:hormogonium polysaccharide biosynthesis protein HpsA [Microcoleus sp. herbarium8]|uniref:hormogonium polysaccharide biosynthesis protein HpsA n=1 Tax=Microcoleus sp. herbarium8 TaxID=3055436 RepID=UPI002FD12FC8